MWVNNRRLRCANFNRGVQLKNFLPAVGDGISMVGESSVHGPLDNAFIKAHGAVDEYLVGCKVGPFDELPELFKLLL